jgi:4a-hydroxytetrahydrobiopterin dehydratase
MPALLSAQDVRDALASLPGWAGSGTEIRRHIEARDFPTAIRLVDRVAEKAEERDHHPDIDIRWRTVTFSLSTHSEGGVTELDVAMARTIDAIASTL